MTTPLLVSTLPEEIIVKFQGLEVETLWRLEVTRQLKDYL